MEVSGEAVETMGMGWDFKRIGGLTPPPFSLHERYFLRKQKPSWYIHSSLLETKKLPQILADQIYLLLLLHQLGCHILRPDWLKEKYNSLSRRILGGLGSRLTLSAKNWGLCQKLGWFLQSKRLKSITYCRSQPFVVILVSPTNHE